MLYLLVSIRFQVLFHSPPGVLFTFPSQYYTLSVTRSYLALRDGPRIFPQDSSCPVVLRILHLFSHFAYGIVTLFDHFSNMFGYAIVNLWSPQPRCISLYSGLGSSPFARHYSENHLLIFSSSGYLDVSVPRVPLAKLCIHLTIPALRQVSSLIRISADRSSCAAPRSFSQLVTSFFGA